VIEEKELLERMIGNLKHIMLIFFTQKQGKNPLN